VEEEAEGLNSGCGGKHPVGLSKGGWKNRTVKILNSRRRKKKMTADTHDDPKHTVTDRKNEKGLMARASSIETLQIKEQTKRNTKQKLLTRGENTARKKKKKSRKRTFGKQSPKATKA